MSARALPPDVSTVASPSRYAPGEILLGRYRLIEPLAVGGMGAVWRAHNQLLDAEVAVKVMVRLASDPTGVALQRAHREARLAAQLRHPAVCATIDFGISDRGDPVVVSELLHGEGLDEVLESEGPLSTTRAGQLLLPVLDGLAAAHSKGIVHRDVKPSNIFLARDEAGNLQPKLIDFGIARGLSDKQRITVAGLVCGTPDYMSPEQASGSNDVDWRSDLWSVCVSLYELVSGRVPFEANNYNAVMFAVIHRPYAHLGALGAEDHDFLAIIERGLSKDRAARFQSARELARQVSMFLLARGVDVDACGHLLRTRLSVPEIQLTIGERAPLRTTPMAVQLAPTLPRSMARVGVKARSARRLQVLALAVTSLLGVAAGSFASLRTGPADLAGERAALPLPELQREELAVAMRSSPPTGEIINVEPGVAGSVAPLSQPGAPSPVARRAAAFASSTPAPAPRAAATQSAPDPAAPEARPSALEKQLTTRPARPAKPNLLDYDFGL